MNRVVNSAFNRQALDRLSEQRVLLSSRVPSVARQVRMCLGMTLMDMGARMGISHTRPAQIEAAESSGTVQLKLLRRAAEAMECDLVYTFVPRAGSFQAIVNERVKAKAETLDVTEDEAIRRYDFWRG